MLTRVADEFAAVAALVELADKCRRAKSALKEHAMIGAAAPCRLAFIGR